MTRLIGRCPACQMVGAEPHEGVVIRPDWQGIYDCSPPIGAGDLIAVTRETLRLAASALRDRNAADAYHNSMAAEREIIEVLK